MKRAWLHYKFIRRTLIALITGTVVISLLLSFVVTSLWFHKARISDYYLTRRILHTVDLLNKTPADNRYDIVKLARLPNVNMYVIPLEKVRNPFMVLQPAPKHIYDWLHHHKKRGRIYLGIKDQQVLVIRIRPPFFWTAYHPYLQILLIIVLLLLEIALCVWAILRMTNPLVMLNSQLKKLSRTDELALVSGQQNDLLVSIIETINKLRIQGRNAQQTRMQMLAAISHDLRTPLTRLKLRAEYFEGSDEYPKIVEDIKEMEAMITDVLSFAKLDTQLETKQTFDITALLDSMCEDLKDAGFKVNFNSPKQQITFHGSLQALKRALSNVIVNAANYGKEATVSINKKHNKLIIYVDDKGPGIDAHEIEKVFLPFYRVEQSRSRETGGSGLGLYISKEIIESHEGYIKLINRAKGGLRVEIGLPNEV